ncbi:MAG: tyrosine-type recombinase/integrase [Roseofilum sp. SBFL]|uniref:tyrosine-type recombinase/integrase n=1 Tax=Roseofilum sp. SBFL TaxID=2821496 RepID=UPI001B1F2185|nr:tyrosine-type recombinase/integrase [Roseofilum sp. SBFL]MBP0043386.1 tyrosine-type recombinase/integrase [Roseofilum sp. SBFL]
MKRISTIRSCTGKFDRVGNRVSLVRRGNSIKLRWSYQKREYSLSVPGGITKASVEAAYTKAGEIAADISFDRFDKTLNRYDSTKGRPAQSEETVETLWAKYKETQKHKAARTTQQNTWKEIDRAIASLPPKALNLSNLDRLADEYLKIRAASTAHRHLATLQPAIRVAVPGVKLRDKLPKQPRKTIHYFTPDEVRVILNIFVGNHYEHYVTFLAATGCRPEEAIALLPSDILQSFDGTECSITKAYSKEILQPYTKNHLNRTIPLSDQALLSVSHCYGGLIFPSPAGSFINQKNFLRRAWKPLINPLAPKTIRRYLPPYALRHSFISNMHYEHGVPLPTIAFLVGDKIETIMRFYAGRQTVKSSELPILY